MSTIKVWFPIAIPLRIALRNATPGTDLGGFQGAEGPWAPQQGVPGTPVDLVGTIFKILLLSNEVAIFYILTKNIIVF